MRVITAILAVTLAPVGLVAQEGSPGTRDSDSEGTRGISPSTSAALSAGIRYAPPKPTPVPTEEDKPKNEIVRLPDMVVLGQKPPVFSDRTLRQGSNLDHYAKKRFLSEFDRGILNRFGGPGFTNFSTEKRARILMQEEQRLQNIRETEEHVLLYSAAGEDERAEAARNEAYSTSYRPAASGTRNDGSWYGELR
ncbi:MAG: hypothetical protein SFV32_01035 [Opitutaceae bacterium]|nr:hypothetical protein [Opitutaceae bacterium]